MSKGFPQIETPIIFSCLIPPIPHGYQRKPILNKISLFSCLKKNSSSRKNSTAVQDVISYKINLLGGSNPGRGQLNDVSGIIWSFSEICKATT